MLNRKMLKSILFSFAIFSSLHSFADNGFSPIDSIGVEKKGSKTLILYKVTSGESLYSIARKYKTSVSEIVAENEMPEQKVKIDQVIKVPYTAPKTTKTESKNNSSSIQKTHTVKSGEGLFKISQLYKVSVADIKKWNDLTDDKVKLGQELLVSAPTAKQIVKEKETEKTDLTQKKETGADPRINSDGQKIHIVRSGEGLNGIGRLYKVSTDDLRKWNNLDSDNLSLGQELILEDPKTVISVKNTPKTEEKTVETKETKTDITPKKETEKTEEKKVAVKEEKIEEKKQPEKEKVEKVEKVAGNPNNYVIVNESGFQKMIETGMGEAIDDPQSNDMFLALHRTAPVGTIIQVRNLMNDKSVFVKVIGKLPDTGANDKLIVKISKRAYERLAAIDKRFRVEVSYMPQ